MRGTTSEHPQSVFGAAQVKNACSEVRPVATHSGNRHMAPTVHVTLEFLLFLFLLKPRSMQDEGVCRCGRGRGFTLLQHSTSREFPAGRAWNSLS